MDVNVIAVFGGTYFVPFFVPPLLVFNFIFVLYLFVNLRSMRNEGEQSLRDWGIWLSLLPLFNLIWLFFVVRHVQLSGAQSSTGDVEGARHAAMFGYAFAACNLIAYIPPAGIILAPTAFIAQIGYWLKLRSNFLRYRLGADVAPA